MMEEPRRLGNRYELGAVLGRGGMAEVYMARDIRLGRAVAVKTLRADMARDATFQARFRREAQSAASLNHPAIVAVYDTGEDFIGGVSLPFIVMEYVDGSTLRDLLHSGRKLLPERTLEITSGVLQALDYSHRNGIVHRDIKPANVMLTRGGAVKVMDFGIARAMGDAGMTMTQTAAVIGTAQYLSPEQAKGEQVDARSDLYSTGCLLYELLTGRPPFIGDSPVAVAYQHVREAAQPPSFYDPEVPAVVDSIVMKSLAKHPDERYQSADEMRADLERALDGRPVAAAPTVAAGFGATPAPTQVMSQSGRGYGSGQGGAAGYGSGGRYDQQTGYQGAGYPQEAPEESVPRSRRAPSSTGGGRGKSGGGADRTGWVIIGVVVLVLVVVAVIVFNTVFSGKNGTVGTVPPITNLTTTQAEATLKTSGYVLGKSNCGDGLATTDVKAGLIVKQSPAGGATVNTGTAVDYCVSLGPETHVLMSTVKNPDGQYDLNGQQTVATLEQKYNYTDVTSKQVSSNSVAAGYTIDIQDPKGDSLLGKTEPVNQPLVVIISGGPSTTTVPPVAGQTCDAAQQTLKGSPYNFVVNESNQLATDGTQQGYAIGTNPSANQTVDIGSPVTLICSLGAQNGGNGNGGNGGNGNGGDNGGPAGGASPSMSPSPNLIGGLGGGNN
nr:Stk1 family PASTA domain-containing Ser/Thr kinase [Actinospica robiniae]